MAGGGRRAILAAAGANLGIAVSKLVAFAFTGSASMLAESIHSLADTSNQGLLLHGGARARRAPTVQHPFGHGRERYFWSFVVALVLFSVGGLFALFEGYEKIRHPEHLESVGWAVGVLLGAIALESYSFRTAIAESRPLKGSRTWPEFVRTARTPELPIVLLEDTGALLGLALALVGVGLTIVTGDPVWDGVGTAAIGALLVAIALVLAWEMKSLLIGEAATEQDVAALSAALAGTPEVRRVLSLRTQHLGPEELLVAAKIELDHALDFAGVSAAINAAEEAMRAAVPAARLIFLEPDRYDADRYDADRATTDQ